MIRPLIFLLACLSAPLAQAANCGTAFPFCRTGVINHLLVSTSDQTNFTTLFSFTDNGFRTTGNGGHVNNTVTNNGQTVPADLVFSTTADCGTLMNWEVEHYDATTGNVVAHFKVGTLSHTVDTTIWVCYGKSAVVTFPGGAFGTAWDAATVAVYHLADVSPNDSSANLNNGVATGAPGAIAGKVDGAGSFSLGNDINAAHIAAQDSNNITVSAWIKTSDAGAAESIIDRDNHTSDRSYQFRMASGKMQFIPFLAGGNDGIAGTVTINDNVFHLLAATYDGTTARQYIDGVADGTNAAFGGNLNPAAGIGIVIGDAAGAGGQAFIGVIDEAKQANVARSVDWIVTEFNNQSSPGTFITLGPELSAGVPTSQVFIFM